MSREKCVAAGHNGGTVFINPMEDIPFKILFGPENRRNMINLLRAILDRDISEIEYIDTEKLGLSVGESKSQYDLSVLFADGSRCIVECQMANLRYFNYRSLYYCSHLVQLQAHTERDAQHRARRNEGKTPFWNYHFNPVYVIGILENGSDMMGRALDDVSAQGYLFHYRNIEINCHADMMVDVNYIYLHLDRFDKSAAESVSLLDQFAFALKHMEGQDSRPEDFSREEMQNLYDTAMFANLSPEQAHTIEINKTMTTENDWLVAIHEEAERALARGLAEGEAKGEVKGEAKGEAKLKQVAANFKKLGVSVADIVTATGLPEDVVEAL